MIATLVKQGNIVLPVRRVRCVTTAIPATVTIPVGPVRTVITVTNATLLASFNIIRNVLDVITATPVNQPILPVRVAIYATPVHHVKPVRVGINGVSRVSIVILVWGSMLVGHVIVVIVASVSKNATPAMSVLPDNPVVTSAWNVRCVLRVIEDNLNGLCNLSDLRRLSGL